MKSNPARTDQRVERHRAEPPDLRLDRVHIARREDTGGEASVVAMPGRIWRQELALIISRIVPLAEL
jgi:hypothetical protein